MPFEVVPARLCILPVLENPIYGIEGCDNIVETASTLFTTVMLEVVMFDLNPAIAFDE